MEKSVGLKWNSNLCNKCEHRGAADNIGAIYYEQLLYFLNEGKNDILNISDYYFYIFRLLYKSISPLKFFFLTFMIYLCKDSPT